jgi:hypothetical protein
MSSMQALLTLAEQIECSAQALDHLGAVGSRH